MDGHRLDLLSRWVVTSNSRRATRRALAAGAIAIGLGRFGQDETEAKKGKKKLKKNEFGCVNVGGTCRGKDSVCCSGICQGKKPKKGKQDKSRCVAHNELDCPAGADLCAGNAMACGTQKTACFQTTGQASFCAFSITGLCQSCTKDVECEASQGPGAACVVCADCSATGNTGCFAAGV